MNYLKVRKVHHNLAIKIIKLKILIKRNNNRLLTMRAHLTNQTQTFRNHNSTLKNINQFSPMMKANKIHNKRSKSLKHNQKISQIKVKVIKMTMIIMIHNYNTSCKTRMKQQSNN